jgi:hypothetical protein
MESPALRGFFVGGALPRCCRGRTGVLPLSAHEREREVGMYIGGGVLLLILIIVLLIILL